MTTGDRQPPAAGNVPDRPLAGMGHLGTPEVELTTALAERREAVAELGGALRELISSAIGTEATVDVLRTATADAQTLAAVLGEQQRRPEEPSSVDDLRRGQRLFNPVVGVANPVAPPMRVEINDGAAVGWCTLDWRYEGPFTFAHGGVSALLLDQIMGYAVAAAGHPGVTGRLEVRYRTAVPLGQPLRLEAKFIDVLGVRAAVRGSISLAGEPDSALVEAEGRFLALRPEQAERLFGSVYGSSD
ncbi:MAG: PaaI family thioesterase [Acidimicrobiales bacterium]